MCTPSPVGLLQNWSLDLQKPVEQPPPCLIPSRHCGADCDCDSSTARTIFSRELPIGATSLDEQRFHRLRIFFLDGHSGPLNDMLAFLQNIGETSQEGDAQDDKTTSSTRFTGMLFGQAAQMLKHIDGAGFRDRKCSGGPLGPSLARSLRAFLTGSRPQKHGACVLLPVCLPTFESALSPLRSSSPELLLSLRRTSAEPHQLSPHAPRLAGLRSPPLSRRSVH